jgi:hypothetical protein
MGFMRPAAPPPPSPEVTAAQDRAEQRAMASEREQAQQASARMRTMRTGGLRLLFSPARQEGAMRSTLGSSGGMMQ